MKNELKPTERETLGSDSWDLLKQASFLMLEPQGEVGVPGSDAIYAQVDVCDAQVWTISAGFPSQPPLALFDIKITDRDRALAIFLKLKGKLPGFFWSACEKFEIKATTVRDLLAEMRKNDVDIDDLGTSRVEFERRFDEWLNGSKSKARA